MEITSHRCRSVHSLCRFTQIRVTVLLANSDVTAGKYSSPQVPPHCRKHKTLSSFQACELGKTWSTAVERLLKPNKKWWGEERLQGAVTAAVSQDTCTRAPAAGADGMLKPSETCWEKGMIPACLCSHFRPPFFLLLDSGITIRTSVGRWLEGGERTWANGGIGSGLPILKYIRCVTSMCYMEHMAGAGSSEPLGAPGCNQAVEGSALAPKLNFISNCKIEVVNGNSLWCAVIFMDENPCVFLLICKCQPLLCKHTYLCFPSYKNLVNGVMLKSKCVIFTG